MAKEDYIPVLKVKERNLARAWENAVLRCWYEGVEVRTEYDKEGDPPSKDCTMIIEVEDPFSEPRIHRCFPGGLENLEEYRQELINGIHNGRIDMDPKSPKWKYTYHARGESHFKHGDGSPISQFDYVVEKLAETPYSRRVLISMWDVHADPGSADPPCVQYVWFRILNDTLNMNVHIRSNDAYKAAFMNLFGFTELQRHIAIRISLKMNKGFHGIKIGRAVWMADSFHIYGSYYDEFKGFLKTVERRTFEERTWTTEFAEPFFHEARQHLAKEKEGR